MDPLFGAAQGRGAAPLTSGLEAWYLSIPPVTRSVLLGAFALTLLTTLSLVPAGLLNFDCIKIFQGLQVWRLLTNVLFVGKFSFGWVIHMYMWSEISSALEKNPVFAHAKGAYLCFLLFAVAVSCGVASLVFWPRGLLYHGESLLFAVIYYWSRREAYSPVSIYFLKVPGYQVPFVLMILHLLMGKNLWADALGMAAGHAYYFFREALPAQGSMDLFGRCPRVFDTVAAYLEKNPFSIAPAPPASAATGRPLGGSSFGEDGRGGDDSSGGISFSRLRTAQGSNSQQPFSGRGYTLGSG